MTTYKELFNEDLDSDATLPTPHSFAWLLETAAPDYYNDEYRQYCKTRFRHSFTFTCSKCDKEFTLKTILPEMECEVLCQACVRKAIEKNIMDICGESNEVKQ